MIVKRQHGITVTEYYINLATITFTLMTHNLMPTHRMSCTVCPSNQRPFKPVHIIKCKLPKE